MTRSAQRPLATLAFKCLFALLIPLLSSCSTFLPAEKKANRLELAPAPYFDVKTGIYFPGALGSLHRQPVVKLEERNPGLGLAITYRNELSRIDIFVYDLQASIIPSGIDSEVAQQSFADALSDLERAQRKRIFTQLEIDQSSVADLVGTPFLHTGFSYRESFSPKQGELYVAGVNSQILKIRTAFTPTEAEESERLLAYLGQAIRQSQRNGYGGVDDPTYRQLSSALSTIDLSDGLSQSEAIAIAQMELARNKRHNRYDLARATVDASSLPQSAVVSFPPYPTEPQRIVDTPLEVTVLRNGDAILREPEA